MASIGAKVEAAKAKKQHVFQGERVQAFSDAVFAIVATFAVRYYVIYSKRLPDHWASTVLNEVTPLLRNTFPVPLETYNWVNFPPKT